VVLSPPSGTGRISHSTIVGTIDAAIGHYNCQSRGLQRRHRDRQRHLLRKRPQENRCLRRPRSFLVIRQGPIVGHDITLFRTSDFFHFVK
jgi:hypothetical protein